MERLLHAAGVVYLVVVFAIAGVLVGLIVWHELDWRLSRRRVRRERTQRGETA